jgi:hypothetical protein
MGCTHARGFPDYEPIEEKRGWNWVSDCTDCLYWVDDPDRQYCVEGYRVRDDFDMWCGDPREKCSRYIRSTSADDTGDEKITYPAGITYPADITFPDPVVRYITETCPVCEKHVDVKVDVNSGATIVEPCEECKDELKQYPPPGAHTMKMYLTDEKYAHIWDNDMGELVVEIEGKQTIIEIDDKENESDENMSDWTYCSGCNQELPPQAIYCPACGKKVDEKPPEPSIKELKRELKEKKRVFTMKEKERIKNIQKFYKTALYKRYLKNMEKCVDYRVGDRFKITILNGFKNKDSTIHDGDVLVVGSDFIMPGDWQDDIYRLLLHEEIKKIDEKLGDET